MVGGGWGSMVMVLDAGGGAGGSSGGDVGGWCWVGVGMVLANGGGVIW